ncbi:unnamed protein product [Cylindrotheca closterium]|uniref:RNA methyltransferase n=1 Tax=Cylindrotheca closterium TaxID=2856 RepID=A0AAD2GBT9_9STRA|nr:unnamed protein product [Cylindrotheca closterium]
MSQVNDSRQKRKEEGRLKKRQKIEEAGGVRPRKEEQNDNGSSNKEHHSDKSRTFQKRPKSYAPTAHRFGRVMENVPCRKKPRFSTLSIALPGSVLTNCQTKELRTLMVGQIARAATIYHVDEIIVFDDKLGRKMNENSGWRRQRDMQKKRERKDDENQEDNNEHKEHKGHKEQPEGERRPRSNPQEFMARLLQYCECPQYLRRHFFPMHPDLQFAGLLAPTDAPHHVRVEDHSQFREGVVLEKRPTNPSASLVNCGIRSRPVQIDRRIAPGIRCTVKLDPKSYGRPGVIHGTVVSPSAPRENDGTYWGYTTRMASSINAVFDECPFEGGYDLKIGTSERGDKSTEDKNFQVPKYEHSLIVFGGVAGIEECVDADESIKLPGSQSKNLFDIWLNTCPYQGSRTIRTEEAVLISLANLSVPLAKSSRSAEVVEEETPEIEFSDNGVSEESSSEEEEESDNEGSS